MYPRVIHSRRRLNLVVCRSFEFFWGQPCFLGVVAGQDEDVVILLPPSSPSSGRPSRAAAARGF
jgi:hypothetical protein